MGGQDDPRWRRARCALTTQCIGWSPQRPPERRPIAQSGANPTWLPRLREVHRENPACLIGHPLQEPGHNRPSKSIVTSCPCLSSTGACRDLATNPHENNHQIYCSFIPRAKTQRSPRDLNLCGLAAWRENSSVRDLATNPHENTRKEPRNKLSSYSSRKAAKIAKGIKVFAAWRLGVKISTS